MNLMRLNITIVVAVNEPPSSEVLGTIEANITALGFLTPLDHVPVSCLVHWDIQELDQPMSLWEQDDFLPPLNNN